MSPQPDRIVYCYYDNQPAFDRLKSIFPKVEMHQGLPNVDNFNPKINNLLILDDLMEQAGSEHDILKLFTCHSHHRNISVFLIVQNLFHKSKYGRSISLNSHIMLLLSNPRDRSQIFHLARQMYPEQPNSLIEAYKDATLVPHGYLYLNFTQDMPETYRVQTAILPGQERIIYQPKDYF